MRRIEKSRFKDCCIWQKELITQKSDSSFCNAKKDFIYSTERLLSVFDDAAAALTRAQL